MQPAAEADEGPTRVVRGVAVGLAASDTLGWRRCPGLQGEARQRGRTGATTPRHCGSDGVKDPDIDAEQSPGGDGLYRQTTPTVRVH